MENMTKELISFWRKFGHMIDSGVPILQTLNVILEETSNEQLKPILSTLMSDIKSGSDMSSSLAKYPSCFPPSIQTIIKAGEATGNLEKVVSTIADGLEVGTFKIDKKVVTAGAEYAKEAAESLREQAETRPGVIKLVSSIILEAFRSRASDIHFEWVKGNMRIRYRIDGVLQEAPTKVPEGMEQSVINRIKIMAGLNAHEKRLPQDGRIMLKIKGKELDIRTSVVPYVMGESVVMRILGRQNVSLDLESQGFTEPNLEMLRKWSKKPGIIIVTGPTGCGKTTTLYSILQELNSPKVKITTVEEPVEYLIDGINQEQVNPRLGLTFAHAIRSQMRQDPDIIMVGEIRDLETVQLIFQVSLTGHLVLSTLHTHDTLGAIRRLLDIGAEPFLINSSLTGVVSQRLVRIICKDCKEEAEPEEWVKSRMKDHKGIKFFKGKGCKNCNNTGYRGRIAIHELLELDEPLRRLIAQDAGWEELRKQAIASGMIAMKEDGFAKVNQGITSIEEVLRVGVGWADKSL